MHDARVPQTCLADRRAVILALMTLPAKQLTLALLALAAFIQVAFLLYVSDFAFRLRATVITGQPYVLDLDLMCRPPVTLAPGTYNLKVEASDTAGHSIIKDIKVHVIAPETPAPTPSASPTPTPATPTPTPGQPTPTPPAPTPTPASPTPTPVPRPQCSDGIDNDGDIFVDSADSACHTDSNPNNPNSYGPNRPSERLLTINTQCTDNIDNDQDGLVDGGDPQCHTDGNPLNPASYNPLLTTEQAPATPARCANTLDDDNDGAIDAADSGCHTDGNPNNPNSYDPNDQDEGGTPVTECSDNKDNDNDSYVDGGDPDCHDDGKANNPNTYDPTWESEDEWLDDKEDEDADPPASDLTVVFQAEDGHSLSPNAGGPVTDGSRRVLALYHGKDAAAKAVSVPKGDYWLSLTAKHDRPGPVDVGVYVNGFPWKSVTLNANDNGYRTHTLGRLNHFSNATITFKFLQDRFEGYGLEDIDRNLYLDYWTLSTRQNTPSGVGGAGRSDNPGEEMLPFLNSIIREELGPEHVNPDIWQFYARRLVAKVDSPQSIISIERLLDVMQYWRGVRPENPRGS